MAATNEQLEQRLSRVEQQVQRLADSSTQQSGVPWWERIIGDYAEDDDFDEIIKLGAEWRKQQQELL